METVTTNRSRPGNKSGKQRFPGVALAIGFLAGSLTFTLMHTALNSKSFSWASGPRGTELSGDLPAPQTNLMGESLTGAPIPVDPKTVMGAAIDAERFQTQQYRERLEAEMKKTADLEAKLATATAPPAPAVDIENAGTAPEEGNGGNTLSGSDAISPPEAESFYARMAREQRERDAQKPAADGNAAEPTPTGD